MRLKKMIRKNMSIILILALVVASMNNTTTKLVQAATKQEILASTYLNASEKYLYLGGQGSDTYNFNLKKEVKIKGNTYFWYVKTDKGNAKAVTINKKNGVVTAREVGTAYIRCKITLKNGTVFRPEAKVVVQNNKITTATTQEQLNKLLKANDVEQITLSTQKALTFVIPKGNYNKTNLIVDTPNADVDNYGIFKNITIKAIKDNTWIEYADGNIVYLSDDTASFVIDKNVNVKRIVIDRADSELNLKIDGTVDQIVILQPASVNFSGSGAQVPVTVETTAAGSTITSSMPLDVELKAKTDITLNEGAGDTILDKSESNVVVKIENKTNKDNSITTNNSGGEIIGTGETVISDGSKITTGPITTGPITTGPIITDPTTPGTNVAQSAPTGLAGVAPSSYGLSDGKITGTTTLMEYKLSTASTYITATTTEITGLVAGTYNVRYAAKTGFNAGVDAVVVVVVGANVAQSAPTVLAGVAPSSYGLSDGKITGTTTLMEYKLSTASTYITATATEIIGLVAGSYNVRYAAKTGFNAGADAVVVVAVGANVAQIAPTGLAGVAPTSYGLSDGMITGTTVLMEYKLSTGGSYTTATATQITGLVAGTYNVRYAAKTGFNAGADAVVVVAVGANAAQLAPTGLAGAAPTSFGASNGKITGTTTLMEYKLSGGGSYMAATATEITGLVAGTYNVRFAAKTGFNAGADAVVVVAVGANAAQLAPTGLAGTAPTSYGLGDGKLTGTTTLMEYKLSTASTYITATATEITGLVAGTYNVRYAAKTGFNAGADAVVVVAVGANVAQLAPTGLAGVAPTSYGLSDGTITGTTTLMEYKLSTASTYITATATEITGLVAGTYNVRFAAKTGFNAGTDAVVVVAGGNATPTASSVTITGNLLVGQVLTGNYAYADAEGDAEGTSTYQWYRYITSSGGSKTAIVGATSRTYTLGDSDKYRYLSFEVTPVAATGTTTGASVGSARTNMIDVVDALLGFNAYMSGFVGSAMSHEVSVATIRRDTLKNAIPIGTDLSSWITNLPSGMTAVAKATYAAGATGFTLVVAGTPTSAVSAEIAITIPKEYLTLGGIDLVAYTNPADVFKILGAVGPSAEFALTAENDIITITLTGGTFKTGTIYASDFTFTGTNSAAIAAGTFTRISDTVVTVTGITGLTGTDNTVLVKAATQGTQATSVNIDVSTLTDVTSSAFTTTVGDKKIVITLTNGTFKAGTIVANDFVITGTDQAVLTDATTVFTRTSANVVTISYLGTLNGSTDNTIMVKAEAQTSQASSITATSTSVMAVGDYYAGGRVGYIFVSGDTGYIPGVQHGLIISAASLGTSAWSNVTATLVGAIDEVIGSGQANTTAIISQPGHTTSAAKMCNDYSVTINAITYDDWYLPSLNEASSLFTFTWSVGSLGSYWTSTERGDVSTQAWMNHDSSANTTIKTTSASVRAFRNF